MKLSLALAAMAVLSSTSFTLADETCDSMAKVIAANSDLSVLRGPKVSDDAWTSTAVFPDFDTCLIKTFKQALMLACNHRSVDHADVMKTINLIADKMWACDVTTSRTYMEYKKLDYGVEWAVFAGDTQFPLSGGEDMFSTDPGTLAVSMSVFEK